MKTFLTFLAAVALSAAPVAAQNQFTYTAQSGVSFFVSQNATATATSGAVRLPTFNGAGTLNIIGAGITGSPSGCTIVLKYISNVGGGATGTISSTSFTPASSTQQFTVTPSVANGDNYEAVYACSSTYPTAGTISVSFSPSSAAAGGAITVTNSGDPCQNPNVAKSSAVSSISSATTTALVAASGTKAVYVCNAYIASVGGTSTLEYGTGSTCGSGTTALTGAFAAASTVNFGYGGTVVTAPASNALCLLSGTSTSATVGVLTYIQQ